MVDTEVLAALPLFASLDKTQLEKIAPWFEPRSVSVDVELVGQGASGYSFFILTDGQAVVAVDDATIAWLEPGDFFCVPLLTWVEDIHFGSFRSLTPASGRVDQKSKI